MKILVYATLFLLTTTLVFADSEYTKIDDQNFKKSVEVVYNYEALKNQWQIDQNQIDNLMVDVNKHRAHQLEIEAQIAELEAIGAKAKSEEENP